MDAEKPPDRGRCTNCRSDIEVSPRYAHGDHIKCGACGTQHRVQRGPVLRLVLADVAPVKSMVRDIQKRIADLETQHRAARHSIGIGVNGIGLGVAWIVFQVGMREAQLSRGLFLQAIALAIVSGVILEILNYFVLAKRKQMTRLSGEIATLKAERRQLEQKIREASRF